MTSDNKAARLVETVLKTVTYKEGWTFRVLFGGDEFIDPPRLRITFKARDATGNVSQILNIVSERPIPPVLEDSRDVVGWLRSFIADMERHEADEWLKVDGKAPFYPH